MSSRILKITLISVLFITLFPIHAFADGITLDGNFDDWAVMPQLSDRIGDASPKQDLVLVKWYPDTKTGKLYFYCERLSGSDDGKGKKFEDWAFTGFLNIDGVKKRIYIYYHPPSQKVDVTLYDEKGNFVWSASGKWGDDKSIGKSIEFYLPFQYLTTSIVSGYQIEAYFVSGPDRTPDSGTITISTVSTFPVQSTFGVIILSLLVYFVLRRKFYRGKTVLKSS